METSSFGEEISSSFVSIRDRLHENGELAGSRVFVNVIKCPHVKCGQFQKLM